ncbi:2-amino-4-hydroxy-6-hydroxymethyldihydropteridine diphosphokinase [Treponema rectale]|uniref:2-amino-4-hydroxy-6-hydroxymethyldihydropteridine pyrophosphokinase n=1 Tax=Treponema rectale TaxID=744512 RepID=A0A7M1XKE9_9SPIR|nr:2-amino-4-hydroxy-6-hydroxymethyldihydropteridine diphosphokinase [Treponema rectale]MBB5218087.1 2-amino-4-hydroxy-6-hydroxymethyldihydropteridine diphosphokinase [Treponema rectale]QOS40199.1 2-amino-4-hydroxy-6-hydroxymethyldihydropteridine diphosphokinase [Treponema rectale]
MTCTVLGLGSNKGFQNLAPGKVLDEACRALSSVLKNAVFSSVYVTKPMYYEDQDYFHNMVCAGWYEGTAFELLDEIHRIEASFGRDRSKEIRYGCRSLDIDIELFGKEKISEENLVVPHEKFLERSFVLTPFHEVLKKYADIEFEGCLLKDSLPFSKEYIKTQLDLLKTQEVVLERS